MAINQVGNALTFYFFYEDSANLDGETGLTVTVDVYEGVTQAPIVTAGSASELAGGLYYYTLASGSVDAQGAYVAMAKTTSADVVQKWIPAIWSVWTNGAPVDAIALSGDTAAADNAELMFDGTGYAGGTTKLQVDLAAILGTALTETAGWLAAGFKKLFNVATPVTTLESVNQTGDSYAVVTNATYGLDKLARTGADSDTLETLSDQIDLQATAVALATAQADLDNPAQYKADVSALALEATAQSILTDTGTTLPTDIAALPTASENADQVWEEAIADHSGTAGSTAEALNAAGAAGDPWNTELPGAYTTGKAGYIIGTTFAGQLTSLINRLGAFTGSGVNTVLGFLQAIMRKDVTTPTDAGGTYDDATDSLEALRDKVDTLPSTTAQTSAASESGAIAAVAYATLAETVSGLSIPADWTKCIFTVKGDLDDADSAALIQIVESNPGVAADGLLYLNGDDPTEESLTAADGSLTVDQAAQTVAIYLTDEAMAVLGFFGGFYDIKTVDADGDTLRQDYGTLDVSETATRATS